MLKKICDNNKSVSNVETTKNYYCVYTHYNPNKHIKVGLCDSRVFNDLALYTGVHRILICYRTNLKDIGKTIRVLNAHRHCKVYLIRTCCDKYFNKKKINRTL